LQKSACGVEKVATADFISLASEPTEAMSRYASPHSGFLFYALTLSPLSEIAVILVRFAAFIVT
jgi:hypothetical protein